MKQSLLPASHDPYNFDLCERALASDIDIELGSTNMQSLQGKFLVAARHLNDPNFYKTVVLIIDHNEEGAMGLVVNRPSSLSVAAALSHQFNLGSVDGSVHFGGPVDREALFILHNASDVKCCKNAIVPGVFSVGTSSEFEQVLEDVGSQHEGVSFRVFHGCAGWAPDQLESEIDRGDWMILNASAESTFHEDPYELWDLCLEKVFIANRILPHTTRNPEWN